LLGELADCLTRAAAIVDELNGEPAAARPAVTLFAVEHEIRSLLTDRSARNALKASPSPARSWASRAENARPAQDDRDLESGSAQESGQLEFDDLGFRAELAAAVAAIRWQLDARFDADRVLRLRQEAKDRAATYARLAHETGAETDNDLTF
jgi:hypothetical protein